MRGTSSLLAPLLALAVTTPLWAAAELRLLDGRRLEGRSVERSGDLYVLELHTGERVTIPLQLVREMTLTADAARSAEPDAAPREPQPRRPEQPPEPAPIDREEPAPGDEPAQRTPDAPGPSTAPALSSVAQQLGVFGMQRARSARDLIEPGWRPSSQWVQDTLVNEFDPSQWSAGLDDRWWRPSQAFEPVAGDGLPAPSGWSRSTISARWRPEDGFAPGDERNEPEAD